MGYSVPAHVAHLNIQLVQIHDIFDTDLVAYYEAS